MPTESTFVLAGLFILAAACGWAIKVYSDRDRDPPARISADYIRGLNLVLNRRTDEALELFVQMAKVDDETLETHFALGHLFRRRGEIERAIRVHENLLARPNLNEAQRDQALFSLAEDYLGAGLYDRAEQHFLELADSETLAQAALEKLVYIYEREREWLKAIEAQRKLEVLSGEKSTQVAHYYCELAEQARAAGDLELAQNYLKTTVRSESGALRGALIRAAIAHELGDHQLALGLYEQVLESDRRFTADVLPRLLESYERSRGIEEFDRYIERLVGQDPTLVKEIAYAAIINDLTQAPSLVRAVESFVLHNEVLADLVNVEELKSLPPEQRREAIARVARGLRQIALSSARYRCTNCGYSTQRFIWHCPSCKLWETVRPIHAFQLEALVA
ncbi:MAG TPA: tetratricopeptide repeat protein [Gammaproteobacteria bacterium]